ENTGSLHEAEQEADAGVVQPHRGELDRDPDHRVPPERSIWALDIGHGAQGYRRVAQVIGLWSSALSRRSMLSRRSTRPMADMARATTSNAASESEGSSVLTASTAARACSGEQSVRCATTSPRRHPHAPPPRASPAPPP